MRPTWYAATIVEPFAKVSGSTSVSWLVVLDPLHVACVNGSELMSSTAASAAGATASAAVIATPSARERRRDSDRSDRRISYFLSTTDQGRELAAWVTARPPMVQPYTRRPVASTTGPSARGGGPVGACRARSRTRRVSRGSSVD